MNIILCLTSIFSLLLNFCVCKKYYNYTLYRGIPVTEKHLDFFKNLSVYYDVSYWRAPGLVKKQVEFVIKPEDKEKFLRDAEENNVYLTTMLADVQSAFDMQTVKTYIRRRMDSFDWRSFFRLADIYNWLNDLQKYYPGEIQLKTIGRTVEDRPIIAVKLILKDSKRRSTVLVEGGIHAREWISPAFVTYMIHQILTAPESNNQALKDIALTYEWYFIPVLNPDGYEYSHTEDRLWRKNRGDYDGVDLNRNFGLAFGSRGISFDKTSEIYCGKEAFSERETAAWARFVSSKSEKLEYYLAFHSYGQFMILPYAHSKRHWDNYDEVKQMGQLAASKILRTHKTHYIVGTAYDTVGYVTSGVSGCWVKKEFGVPYVVTFELRDSGEFGFALPPNKILPTCYETMDGVLSLLTPRTSTLKKLNPTDNPQFNEGKCKKILDKIVIVCNVLLFIIVRFD